MQHTTYNVRQARATCIAFASSQASRYEHMLWLLEHMQAHTNEGATSGAMPYAHMELPQPDVCSFATAIDALIKDERIDEVKTCHICAGTGLAAATSALGLRSPLPTSAPGLRRDCARPSPCRARPAVARRRDAASDAQSARRLVQPPARSAARPAALGVGRLHLLSTHPEYCEY